MIVFDSIKLILLIASSVLAINTKLHELIARVHGETNSATVYFIGIDEDFLAEFVKTEVFTPISTFSADFTEDLRQCTNIIIVVQVRNNDHNHSKLLQNVVRNLQVRKFVIILARNLYSLNRYFSFFAESKFTRIFGIIGNTTSYAYLPFSEHPVKELADSDSLPDALKNLNGFALRTMVTIDIPRTFWYTPKDGPNRIGGQVGQTFLQFLRRHNASFTEILNKHLRHFGNMDVIINATINQEIDISMNAYFSQDKLDKSYPITIEENVIMLPCNEYLDPAEYFRRPFKATVWMCIGLAVIFITISKIVLNSLTNSKLNIWGSFSDIYLTLLSSSSGKPIVSKYRFHLVVILFGFVLGTLYGSRFQSFLTAYVKIKQNNTIHDMVNNNISVIISNRRWDRMKNDVLPTGFDKIVVPTDSAAFAQQWFYTKNTNLAYVLEADRCQFFVGLKSLYMKRRYCRVREALSSYHIGFLLAFHSPFKEILSDFVIEIKQTGLTQKWDSDVMGQVKDELLARGVITDGFRTSEVLRKPLTVHQLKFAWKCLTIGLVISTFALVFEWICMRMRTLNVYK